jgi:hypothetical protein
MAAPKPRHDGGHDGSNVADGAAAGAFPRNAKKID